MGGDYTAVRGFVAINPAEAVRKGAVEIQEALRRADGDVRWVGEATLHLTLKFLGEIGEAQAEELCALLDEEASRWPPIEVTWAGVGIFPAGGVPKVVWIGCAGEAVKLAGAVERAAERIGVPREARPFAAHLTIGRVKSERNAKRLIAAVEGRREARAGRETVTSFELMESTLTPQGSVYSVRRTFPLGSPAP